MSARVSVVIPCFNERATVEQLVDRVLAQRGALGQGGPELEVIVVDDGSTDGTVEVLRETVEPKVARVIYHERNAGKGASLRSGFAAATGDFVLVQDADLEYDPAEYPRILEPLLDDRADVVFGSRFVGGQSHRVLYFWHSVGNRFLTLLSNMLTNLNLTDMEVGHKAFRKDVLDRIEIREDRFGVEPELTAKVAKLGCRIYEVGVSYSGRTYEDGKKIGWKDGVRAIWCIVKYNLLAR